MPDGNTEIDKILILADREFFTPCGACMDWILQFGSPSTKIIVANLEGIISQFEASDLMPHYPR